MDLGHPDFNRSPRSLVQAWKLAGQQRGAAGAADVLLNGTRLEFKSRSASMTAAATRPRPRTPCK